MACLILGIPPRDTSEGVIHVTYMILSHFHPSKSSHPINQLFEDGISMISMNLFHFTKDVQISDTMLVLALDVILSLGFEL